MDNSKLFSVKLNIDIDFITKTIISIVKVEIEAIILYGSYGRGEGAFFIKNGDVFTINDYDILIVVKGNKIENLELDRIKKILESNLKIKWIDLGQVEINNLRKLSPSIFNYDLLNGSNVIWGNKDVLSSSQKISQAQIPLKEAEVLFFTRLYCFIGSLDDYYFRNDVDGERARFFRNQMAKAIFAIIDSLLLIKGQYKSSYRERVKIFECLYPNKKELIELSKWAIQEKINPSDERLTAIEVYSIYYQVLNNYMSEMLGVLSVLYSKKLEGVADLFIVRKLSITEIILRIKHLIKYKSLKFYNKLIDIEFLQALLVEMILLKKMDDVLLRNNIIKTLKRVTNSKLNREIKFDEIRMMVIKLRLGEE